MDIWEPWIVGIVIASALFSGVGGRQGRPRNPRRRAEGRRFRRKSVLGRIVHITDGDGLVADMDGFGRLNTRLAYVDAPEHDQPWGAEAKDALTRLASPGRCRFRLVARACAPRYRRGDLYGAAYGSMKPFHITGADLHFSGHVPVRKGVPMHPGRLGEAVSIK